MKAAKAAIAKPPAASGRSSAPALVAGQNGFVPESAKGIFYGIPVQCLQAKLSVSQPGDSYEQEADRVADQVMRMSSPPCSCGGSCPKCRGTSSLSIQRKHQPDATGGRAEIANSFTNQIGSGQVLDSGTRSFFEPRLGHDLSRVRIHTNDRAAESARQIGARAFTLGRDVVFASGQYVPGTFAGRHLLAHELAHVIQQSTSSSLRNRSRSVVFRKSADKGRCLNDPNWKTIAADPREIWQPANDAIERSYEMTHGKNAILTGSQFEYGGKPGSKAIQLPKGAPSKSSCNSLLKRFLGRSRQLAPDVMDCTDRVFYEIKTNRYAKKGAAQLLEYYALANEIAKQESEPPWKIEYASWYPPHVLMLEPTRRVCTEGTNYHRTNRPGLIIYEVQDRRDRKKKDEEQKTQPEKKDTQQDAETAAQARQKVRLVKQLVDQLQHELDMSEGDHKAQRNLIYNPSYAGYWGYWTNELFNKQPPLLMIWQPVNTAISSARIQLRANNPEKAMAHFVRARKAYLKALREYHAWKNRLPGAASDMKTAIVVSGILIVAAIVAPAAIGRLAGAAGRAYRAARLARSGARATANLSRAQKAVETLNVRVASGTAKMGAADAAIGEMEIITAAELETEMTILDMMVF